MLLKCWGWSVQSMLILYKGLYLNRILFFLGNIITPVKKGSCRPFVQVIPNDKRQIKDRRIAFLWSLKRCWKWPETLYSSWEEMRKLKTLVPNLISLKSLYFINHVVCHCLSQEPIVEGWERVLFKLFLKSPWKPLPWLNKWGLVSTHKAIPIAHFPMSIWIVPEIYYTYPPIDMMYVYDVHMIYFS